MDRTPLPSRPIGPSAARRRPVRATQEEWVSVRPLIPGQAYPTLVEAKIDGLNLADWGEKNREFVGKLYEEKRSLLFRGFDLDGVEGPGSFGAFVDAVSDGPRLPYLDRTTPRKQYGDNIYCTTVFPSDQRMPQHNEGSYWNAWPLKAFMQCTVAPATGGETPVADMHRVHERIDPAIREEFEARDWYLLRNFNDGFGLPWQEVFQTSDKAEVEAFCADNRIDVEWKTGDRLRTRQRRPAIRFHPKTGEALWFNHAAFYHISSRPDSVREALLQEFDEEDLPFHTYYGDGKTIDPAVIQHINAAVDAEEIYWPWRKGDLHLFDNMRLSHGRRPFTGERLILVALTEGFVGTED